MNIFFTSLSGKTIPINVSFDETIQSIKETIEAKEGMPAKEVILVHAGKQLTDGKYVRDYDIQKDSTVKIGLRLKGGTGGKVFVKLLTGKILSIEIESFSDTIEESIMQRVYDMENIHPVCQRYITQARVLDGSRTLADSGI